MKINSAFPSAYLKAQDIPEETFAKVTIAKVTIEDVGGQNKPEDKKPVLYFQGKDKGMVLNKTNANIISKQFGDETDDWIGKTISLYQTEVEFKGDMVPALRVKIKKDQPASNGAAAQPKVTRTAEREPVNPIGDEVEFDESSIPF